MPKKLWVIFLLVVVLTTAGCTGSSKPASTSAPGAARERLFKHAMGETKVPVNPKRVVVLDTGELDSLVALGIKPVGAVTVFQDGDFQEYLKDKVDGVKKVGTISQPNLETIAALKPDLILSSKLRHEKIYDKLAQIAPTVFTESVGVSWKENFIMHADALGKKLEAEKIMGRYNERLTDFKNKMGSRLSTTKVTVIRGLSDHVRIYMNASFIGTVLKDTGLQRPPSQDKNVFMEKATEERIPDLDADVMFYTQLRPASGSDTLIVKLMKNPLWSQLKVVKEGRVYEVPDDYWMLGIGITAANKVIDDLQKHLVNQH